MNLLQDMHVALWAIIDSPRLPTEARAKIASTQNNIWISAASVWEIAIKHSLGRGDMPVSAREALNQEFQAGFADGWRRFWWPFTKIWQAIIYVSRLFRPFQGDACRVPSTRFNLDGHRSRCHDC